MYVTKEDDNPCKEFGIIASECISHVATERSTVVCVFCTLIQASFQTHEGQKTWKTCIEISHHHRYQDASSSKSSGAFCILTCAFDSRIWAKTHDFIISVVEICKYQLNFPNSNRKNPTVYHLKKAKVLGNLFANFANNAVQGLDDFPTSENSPQNSRRSVFFR